jgi:hypothetical protein
MTCELGQNKTVREMCLNYDHISFEGEDIMWEIQISIYSWCVHHRVYLQKPMLCTLVHT